MKYKTLLITGGARKMSLSLLETTALCREITGNKVKIGKGLCNRPGDIAVYLTDNRKAGKEINWKPRKPADIVLSDIFN